jgi:hypothetical protein
MHAAAMEVLRNSYNISARKTEENTSIWKLDADDGGG